MSHLNKKVLGTGAALVALSAFVPNPFMINDALAQATAKNTMNIKASVVNPLGVVEATKLAFGAFAVSAAAGTLTLNAVKTSIKNGVIVTAGTVGKVTFTAPQNAVFTVSIADLAGVNAITLTVGGGGATTKTLKVTKITLDATTKLAFAGVTGVVHTFKNGKTAKTAKVTDVLGKGKATIGGVLHFKPTNIVGIYTGTYTLSTTF